MDHLIDFCSKKFGKTYFNTKMATRIHTLIFTSIRAPSSCFFIRQLFFGRERRLLCSNEEHINKQVTHDKCFTNVVKTIAKSTTYCRKQGDCNGTIIFEVDIMKNSSPLNLKFTIFAMSKPK